MPAVTPTSVGAVDTPDVLPVDQATAIAATQSYAQESLDARDLARNWATKTTGEVVVGQGYGAKKYAQDAATAVLEAQGSLDASVARAQDWATKTSGEVVTGQGYGAKKYSQDAAASLSDMLTKLVGAFSTDPTYTGGSPPWVVGAVYFNTISNKLKIWTSGHVWVDYDAAAQQAASDATAAAGTASGAATAATGARDTILAFWCGAAAADPTVNGSGGALTASCIYFNTTTGKLRTHASGAWVDYDKAAQDALTATVAARDTALSYSNAATAAYNNANVLLSSVSASAIIAQQAANNALLPSLSVLAAAQRAIKISTALVAGAAVAYDTTKDEVSDWPRKCVSQSYLSDTLNTATRGASAAIPAQMFVQGEASTLSIFLGTDGIGALWKSWTVAGLTCVFARAGSIWYGGTGGLYRLDLITDEVFKRDTSGLSICTNQKVADYNQWTATWALVSSAGAIANASVNSIAAATAPNTQTAPARFGLPNPQVSVGNAGGDSLIRWDGVVVNSASTTAVISTCFDLPLNPQAAPNLWTLTAAGVNVTNQYQAASWAVAGLAAFTAAQLGIGTLAKVTACGPGMVAIAGSNGLATLKLDPTNPANSLYRVKTSTYDSGWMVLGKTVLALAESSTDLSAISDAELLVGGASPDTSSGWTAAAGGATLVAGAGTTGTAGWIAYQAITTVVGKRYRVKATLTNGTAAAFFCASSSLNAADLASIGGVAGARELTFVAKTTTTFIQLAMNDGSSAGQTCSFANLSTKATPNEVSGSGVSPAAVGSPTRAQVASGADCAGYSGFSTSNYFRAPHSSSLDMGSADFAVMCPITLPATGSYSAIAQYTDETGASYGSGAYWMFHVESTGAISCTLHDGVNIGAVTTTATIPTSGVHNVAFARRGQFGEIYLDGVRIARTSLGSVGSVSNSGGNLLIGTIYGTGSIIYPAVGKLGKLRLFNYAPTPDQFAFMMADEAGSNVANANELLSGANVQAVAFDPDTGQLAASNSTGGTDVFAGPGFAVKTANWKSTTAINRVRNSAMSGITAGAVAGSYVDSGSTMNFVAGGGLSKSIVSVGPGYFDLRINGTANAASYFSLMLGKYQDAVAVSGQPWTGACQLALIAGSWANVTSPMLVLSEFNSGASTLASSNAALSGLTSSLANKIVSRTFNQATAAYANLDIEGTFANGAVIDFTLRIYQPFLAQVVSFTSFSDGLSANDNHKAVAFAGGDLVVVTGAGVDAFLGVKPGLRETAGGVGAPRRAFYDPTWGQFYGFTTDATPTVFASIPIPEGKAYRFRASVVAVMYGGTATEKAVYDITGVVSRDIGGNVVVVSTTTTVSEVTSTMDCVAQANTTAQTLEIKATGKASTRIAWFDGQELYDVGLMAAA